MLKLSPNKLKSPKKSQQDHDSLIITPILGKKQDIKLPILKKNFKSPRRIPKEYQFLDERKVFQVSKTPLPCYKKVEYSISKDLLLKALNRVQHVTLVKNLTEHRTKREDFQNVLGQESQTKQRIEKEKGNKKDSQPSEEILQDYPMNRKRKLVQRKKSLDLDTIFGE